MVGRPTSATAARRSTTKFDLVEAMGAEFYVHFGVRRRRAQGSRADGRRCSRTRAASPRAADEGETVVVARLDAESKAKTGEQTEVWLDATKMHFFDADSGLALSSK